MTRGRMRRSSLIRSKTNPLPWILDIAKREGCLAEVVSDEEYALALAAGYTAGEIVFNGPIKSRDCFRYALTEGSIVNVDSWREIMAGGVRRRR